MRAGAGQREGKVATALAAVALLSIWIVALGTAPAANASIPARGPKTFRITLNPSRRGRELVGNHVRPILLRLWVRYIPAGGSARTIRRLGLHIPGT